MGFFHGHSQITGLAEINKDISLTPHDHFRLLHRYLDRCLGMKKSPCAQAC